MPFLPVFHPSDPDKRASFLFKAFGSGMAETSRPTKDGQKGSKGKPKKPPAFTRKISDLNGTLLVSNHSCCQIFCGCQSPCLRCSRSILIYPKCPSSLLYHPTLPRLSSRNGTMIPWRPSQAWSHEDTHSILSSATSANKMS